MVLYYLFLLFFLLLRYLVCRVGLLASTLGRALATTNYAIFLPFARSLSPEFLRSPMAAYVSNRLKLLLLSQLFCFLLLLLDFETFGSCFELLLIDDEEVTWAALREIRLCQNVLHSCDRTHFTLIIDILELVHLVWLVNDPVSFLKMDQFVVLVFLLL